MKGGYNMLLSYRSNGMSGGEYISSNKEKKNQSEMRDRDGLSIGVIDSK